MPTHRYVDEPEYGREATRGVRRERDSREPRERDTVRETATRDRRPMEVEPQRVPSRLIDTDMLSRDTQRVANAGVPRQDPRAIRTVPAPRDRDDEMMYDTRPTQYPAGREPTGARRTPYEGEFDDMPASIRPVIDPGRSRDDPRPNYNEYFLPGDGIDREVIQSEICRYLGQDATCKPGAHSDGRRGYIIRAYRALTTEMIRSLKEDSSKYAREKENAVRRNRQPVSFGAFRDQSRYGGDEMMIDEPEERYQPRYEEPRIRATPVTTSYPPESGYSSAYYPVTQPPPPGVDPRYIPGNSTPPSGRTPGYTTSAYPPTTTRPSVPSIPAAGGFTDPRGNIVRDPGYGSYQADPRSRHR